MTVFNNHTNLDKVEDFRNAIINKNNEAIKAHGTYTWILDAIETDLDWAKTTEANKQICSTLVQVAKEVTNLLESPTLADSFVKVTMNRLESLGWRTYLQLVRNVYKQNATNPVTTKYEVIVESEANGQVHVEHYHDVSYTEVIRMYLALKPIIECGVHVQFCVVNPTTKMPQYIELSIDNRTWTFKE